MVEASRHCGAVRVFVPGEPETVTECSCSICRRYGVLWAYYPPSEVAASPPAGATDIYMWGDRSALDNMGGLTGRRMNGVETGRA